MKIVKSSGEKVEYDPQKIRRTLERTGAEPELIDSVVDRVSNRVTEGMTTRKLFTVVRQELRRGGRHLAQRYNLRRGLLRLGPMGYKFEKYVSSILNAYEYTAKVPKDDYAGLCVMHELDVVAETRDGRRIMIEAKFRNRFGDKVRLKDVMSTWARFEDLCEAHDSDEKLPRFDEVWIVTNGMFSDRATQFGICKGIHLVGWGWAKDSLARMVDHASLYPITVIDGLRQWEIDRFSDRDLLLCREVADSDPKKLAGLVGISEDRMRKIWKECKAVAGMQKNSGRDTWH